MLKPVLVTAPAVPLLTTAEAKAQLRVDHSDEDTLITSLVAAATTYLDGYSGVLGRALVQQTWRQDFDAFSNVMRLPVGDAIAITTVTYFDATNTQQTLSAGVYGLFADELGPYMALNPGQSWPVSYERADAVRVTWTAGYGAAAANVPEAIRHAARLLVGHWYEQRAGVSEGSMAEVPMAVDALLAPFRRVSV